MRRFTTADLNKQVGAITDAALREPVLITHHRRPRFVLMSFDEFTRLSAPSPGDMRESFTLETMPPDIEDGILALAARYEQRGHDE